MKTLICILNIFFFPAVNNFEHSGHSAVLFEGKEKETCLRWYDIKKKAGKKNKEKCPIPPAYFYSFSFCFSLQQISSLGLSYGLCGTGLKKRFFHLEKLPPFLFDLHLFQKDRA